MKKLMIFALGVAAVLASCVKNEVEDISKPEEIAFKSFNLGESTRAALDVNEKFMVYAKFSQLGNGSDYDNFWGDAAKQVAYVNDAWRVNDGKTYYWPKAGAISFWGYYPTTQNDVTFDTTNGVKVANVDPEEAAVLMLADPAQSRCKTENKVPIVFKHAGAQVIFRFANKSDGQGYKLTITDVTITEAVMQGDYIYSAWAFDVTDPKGNYTNNTPYSVVVDNVDAADNAYTFKVIPQTLVQSGAPKQIIIKYHVDVDNDTVEYSYNGQYTAAATEWKINTIHYYNITFNFTSANEEILFTPSVEEWSEEPQTFEVNN